MSPLSELGRFSGQTKPLPSKSRPRRSQKCKSTASTAVLALVLNGLSHHLLLGGIARSHVLVALQ